MEGTYRPEGATRLILPSDDISTESGQSIPVTTETLTPWQTYKKHGEHATYETWIEEAKEQIGLGKIRTAQNPQSLLTLR